MPSSVRSSRPRAAYSWIAALLLGCGSSAAPPPENPESRSAEIGPTRPPAERASFPAGLVPCAKDAPPGSCTRTKPPETAGKTADAKAASPDDVVWKVPVGADDPIRGTRGAPVTVAVFADLQCPFCRRGDEDLKQLLADFPKEVRVVWKDCPLPAHRWAEPAAELVRAIRAVQGDEGFWKAHDLLFASQEKLGDRLFRTVAEELGVSWPAARAAIRSARYGAVIQEGIALCDRVDVPATPTVFVNGKKLVGAQPYGKLKELVEKELGAATELGKATGLSGEALYARLISAGKEMRPPSDVSSP